MEQEGRRRRGGGGEVGAGGRLQLSLPVPPPPLLSAVAPSRQTPGGHEGSSYTAARTGRRSRGGA